ncbi:MAG: hypothetical protein JNL70_13640 [Saprospiraceae bacterium]|nr:hypothetical protein [Saprospiraceae bacterium]
MNPIYRKLSTAFLEKANIERDPLQISHKLKEAYPNCHLPCNKTIKRFLNGETANPRESLLGFLAAYTLNKPETEVLEADQKNKLGNFYELFLVQLDNNTATSQAHYSFIRIPPLSKDRLKNITIGVLTATVVILMSYILVGHYIR